MKTIKSIYEAASVADASGMKELAPFLDKEYSKMPTERISMPVKSVSDAIKLAADGEEEFTQLVDNVMNHVEGAEKSGRIKDTWKIEEKCQRYGISPADLDDVSGKVIVVKDLNDLEIVAKLLKKEKKCVRIFDMYSDAKAGKFEDGLGNYEIHANYKLSNGLVAELQIMTRLVYVYKSICWHHAYMAFREACGAMRRGAEKELGAAIEHLRVQMAANGEALYKADKSHGKAPYLDVELTDKELDLFRKYVSGKAMLGLEMLIEHRTKQVNTKITDKDKKLIEHEEY